MKLEPNCIRPDSYNGVHHYNTMCGKLAKTVGTISERHYRENPVSHVDGLLLCQECEEIYLDAEDGGRYGRGCE